MAWFFFKDLSENNKQSIGLIEELKAKHEAELNQWVNFPHYNLKIRKLVKGFVLFIGKTKSLKKPRKSLPNPMTVMSSRKLLKTN
jgi:hypothetical protein